MGRGGTRSYQRPDWCFTRRIGRPSVSIRKTMFMNTILAGFFGGWEIVLILAVVLILFGAKKLPELAKGLGQGIKEFKKATSEVTNEINSAMDDSHYRALPPQERQVEANVQSKPAESHPETTSPIPPGPTPKV